ncbi:MAG: monooxygenase [Actinomycetota bacterium]|nr:monooxygenase [Actinomycetota bacterium]
MSGAPEDIDVVIVGAGISGIAMARQISEDHPGLSYTVLESRGRVGGTWDLFRYPGIRSDSGMNTFAYSFRPWPGAKHFGSGEEIRSYIEGTAAEYGIDRNIRFGSRVAAADWSSESSRWTVTVERGTGNGKPETSQIQSRFLIGCTGYYRYDRGYEPAFPGEENFEGELFHAQHWPENPELNDRDVVVVGSGATAVTVVPALAEAGARVTMLQRSPSYVVTVPNESPLGEWIKHRFSPPRAAWLLRWLGILTEIAQFNLARKFPNFFRRLFISGARKQLPEDFGKQHLNPAYDPWVQRVCFAPDGDYFEAISSGKARVETGNIEKIGPDRIHLEGGKEIEADVIVKATGLDLLIFGDIEVSVDGEPMNPADHLVYKGAMISGVPNFVFVVGYTNASWTLKSELISRFASRFIAEVDRNGAKSGVPVAPPGEMPTVPLLNLDSGYIHRAESRLPKAGDVSPWVLHMNYFSDRRELLRASFDDGAIHFS